MGEGSCQRRGSGRGQMRLCGTVKAAKARRAQRRGGESRGQGGGGGREQQNPLPSHRGRLRGGGGEATEAATEERRTSQSSLRQAAPTRQINYTPLLPLPLSPTTALTSSLLPPAPPSQRPPTAIRHQRTTARAARKTTPVYATHSLPQPQSQKRRKDEGKECEPEFGGV